MTRSVYVYGPKGCGKTTHSELLRKHFGLEKITDEYDSFNGTKRWGREGHLILGVERSSAPPGVRVMSFEQAMEAAR